MWRKFLGFGIPIMLLGVILWIVGAAREGGTLLSFGYILSIIGAMFVHAGLIGAAVGADPRTHSATRDTAPERKSQTPIQSSENHAPAQVNKPPEGKLSGPVKELFESANGKVKKHQYESAIDDLKSALELKPDFFSAEFNLACIYSILKQKEKAYGWLASAIEHGFDGFQQIQTDPDLQFLRSQPGFDEFVANCRK